MIKEIYIHKKITVDTNMENILDDFDVYLYDELHYALETAIKEYDLKTIDGDNVNIYYVLGSLQNLYDQIIKYMQDLIENQSKMILNDIKYLILEQDSDVEIYDVANYTNFDNFNFNLYSKGNISFNEDEFKKGVEKLLNITITDINSLINSRIENTLLSEYTMNRYLKPILSNNKNYKDFLNYFIGIGMNNYDVGKLMKSDLSIDIVNH